MTNDTVMIKKLFTIITQRYFIIYLLSRKLTKQLNSNIFQFNLSSASTGVKAYQDIPITTITDLQRTQYSRNYVPEMHSI